MDSKKLLQLALLAGGGWILYTTLFDKKSRIRAIYDQLAACASSAGSAECRALESKLGAELLELLDNGNNVELTAYALSYKESLHPAAAGPPAGAVMATPVLPPVNAVAAPAIVAANNAALVAQHNAEVIAQTQAQGYQGEAVLGRAAANAHWAPEAADFKLNWDEWNYYRTAYNPALPIFAPEDVGLVRNAAGQTDLFTAAQYHALMSSHGLEGLSPGGIRRRVWRRSGRGIY